MHRSSAVYKKNCLKQICRWTLKWEDSMKLILTMDLFITNMQIFTSQDINWWTVDYLAIIVMFGLSFWRHPFTAEDPLMSKWYNATFLKICSQIFGLPISLMVIYI